MRASDPRPAPRASQRKPVALDDHALGTLRYILESMEAASLLAVPGRDGVVLFWHFLIRHRLTARVWRPLVEASRRRHPQFRRELEQENAAAAAGCWMSSGV